MIMTLVPRIVAAWANFDRIQAYLVAPDDDAPVLSRAAVAVGSSKPFSGGKLVVLDNVTVFDNHHHSHQSSHPPANGTARRAILKNVSFSISSNRILAVTGPVGAGKSSLAKVILGEVAPSSGSVSFVAALLPPSAGRRRGGIGYCAQNPWLPNTTARDAILGPRQPWQQVVDEAWYREVVAACCLDRDFASWRDGDSHMLGSKAVAVSGGQRQRIALARALYWAGQPHHHVNGGNDKTVGGSGWARPVLVLDDPFSALDGATEAAVVERVLGADGIFRQRLKDAAVFLVSSSPIALRYVDEILLLEDGEIRRRGSWDELAAVLGRTGKTAAAATEAGESRDPESEEADVARLSSSTKSDDAVRDLRRKTGDLSLYGTRSLLQSLSGETTR